MLDQPVAVCPPAATEEVAHGPRAGSVLHAGAYKMGFIILYTNGLIGMAQK